MAEAKDKKDSKDVKDAKGGSKKMLIIIVLAVVATAALAGAATWFLLGQRQPAAAEAAAEVAPPEEEEAGAPVFLQIEPIVVNLSGESESVMRVAISVELSGEEQKDKVLVFMPRIQGDLMLLYSSKTREELLSQEGKIKLIDETKSTLNRIVGVKNPKDNVVKSVSITEMIIQ